MVNDLWGLANYDGEQIQCPHCGKPDCVSEQIYCPNCGKPLHNVCTGSDDCEAHGLDQAYEDCFCPSCGAETLFYQEGYIKPIDYWAREEAADADESDD